MSATRRHPTTREQDRIISALRDALRALETRLGMTPTNWQETP